MHPATLYTTIEDEISPNTELDYMENYKPFISEGVVSLVGDENSSQKVKILRDTGATQSLMLDSVLPLTENMFYWCKHTYFRGRNGRFRSPTP